MGWTEISDGRYERSLDPSEAFYARLGAIPRPPGRERWALTSVSRFKTDQPPELILPDLRQAWKQLRHQFPMLAARLEEDKKVYEVPSIDSLQAWLDATIVVEPENADPDHIIGTYEASTECKLHYLPGSSQILLHVNHWRTDAVGLCILTNRFFRNLANPKEVTFGDEGKRLSPSVEEAAGNCEITEEKMKIVEEDARMNLEMGRSVSIPLQGFGRPQGTYQKSHLFSESHTLAIATACKSRGITVTTAAAAALMLTARKYEVSEPRGIKMSFNSWFNLRPYMPPSFVSEEHPLTVMISSKTVSIELLEFDQSIKQIAPSYRTGLSSNPGADLVPLVGARNMQIMESLRPSQVASNNSTASTTKNQSSRPATTPTLNSIGILDKHIQHSHRGDWTFEIIDYRFTIEILGPVVICYVWTFRGKMRLSTVYNETFFDGHFIREFTDSLAETILNELQIKL